MENKKDKLSNLAKKVAMVFGASVAALTGVNASAYALQNSENTDGKTIEFSKTSKVKPMPVMKINLNNPELSKLVAQHGSHSSHSSHNSHNSHSSHYSHYSGAMFT